MQDNIYKLKGKIQHYAWGGYHYIPELLGVGNTDGRPFAEYWLGAHPSAPSDIIMDDGSTISLLQFIQNNPERVLTPGIQAKFGELSFLLKILDVREMLSIQVHPTRENARIGFDAEEQAGIPIHAPYRNYKDKNHKPEVMVALSETFWLLHGFKSIAAIESVLSNTFELSVLLPLFKKQGYNALYQLVMEMEQTDINNMLHTLVRKELHKKVEGLLTRNDPGWWVAKLFEGKEEIGDIDRGIFSIYLFNIVGLKKGEGIFQKAGIPHAYLEGQNVELMANSDNVLRAGLTPKHIDVPELLKHTIFQPVIPEILTGRQIEINVPEFNYPCPVPDFGIHKIEWQGAKQYSTFAASPEIIIAVKGGLIITDANGKNKVIKQGEACLILPNTDYTVSSSGSVLLFKAFVPVV
ncbi:mannose-6-phosphate isomerase, class I [Hydrotalea sp.]|uniref:mannose-6-phosphate isomerase, class I n=2 Tax=Hydrotalea sp. TaxID=2881279 RepID=UPI002619B5F7|nr:mannose-6-phosphate isomerase, class I [Hydrotalea sp.]